MRAKQVASMLGGAVPMLFSAALALAQGYPSKPLRLVTPFPPAGALDVVGRELVPRLGASLGQPVVFENRPGAGGLIGSAAFAKLPPDGYSILLSSASTHSIAPAMNPAMPFDAVKDFTPIVQITRGGVTLIVVANDAPFRSAGDLVAWIRANPGKATYGSGGVGTVPHLNAAALAAWGDLKMVHVPYKGAALVMPDLMAGRVTFMFDSIITARQNVQAGHFRALGVSGGKRAPQLPNVPTLAESGLPGFEPSGAYMGLWGPAGTPPAVVQRVNADMNRILFTVDMKEELAKLGLEPTGGTPEAFAQVIQRDIEVWSEVVRKTGIKPE